MAAGFQRDAAAAFRGSCAIVGVGETRLAKQPGADTRELAAEAILAALEDAGLRVEDVDGFIVDDEVGPRMAPPNEIAAALGVRRSFSVQAPAAGSGYAFAPMLAAMAIGAGQGEVFVSYLSLDFAREAAGLADFSYVSEAGDSPAFEYPFGLVGTPLGYALAATRYRALYGLEERQLGLVATTIRAHGARNPRAQMRKEFSLEDYFESPYLARPLRLLDCCLRTTGAAAFVMTSPGRAGGLRHPPVSMLGAGWASSNTSRRHHWTQRPEFPHRATSVAAERAFSMAGLRPADMDFAQIQDPYSIQVLLQLEDCGFCPPGGAGSFVETDGGIALGGRLPVNTHGGQLSHGYLLSVTHLIEAVRQLRGDGEDRQVEGASHGLVSGFGPGENAVLVLGRG